MSTYTVSHPVLELKNKTKLITKGMLKHIHISKLQIFEVVRPLSG